MTYPNFTIYWKSTPCVRVEFDVDMKPSFQKLNDKYLPVYLYGMDGKAIPDSKRLDQFFLDRCFPKTRQNASELLKTMGLTVYQPKQICLHTQGKVAHDHFWIQYDDQPELI